MRLFSRFKKEEPVDLETVKEIQERVKAMREQIGKKDVELADLFALVREDERSQLRVMDKVTVPPSVRVWDKVTAPPPEGVWPDQVSHLNHAADSRSA